MKYKTNGKTFAFSKDIRDDHKHRLSFDELAQKTFGLSFNNAGFWTDRYRPYVLLDEGKVISNASVSIIDTIWEGALKRYIQLGTVMTAPEYRTLGLAKFLINQIFDDWLNHCDAIYLYANDSVLNFYPKFGFVKANEYQATIQVASRDCPVRMLNMSDRSDIAVLNSFYQKSNPFSELPMINNWGLLMFYCSSFMKNCVYYLEDVGAVVIAEQEQDNLTVFDVYSENRTVLRDIISAIAKTHSTCSQVQLGFALKNASPKELSLLNEENSTLFVLEGKENIFKDHQTMFPLLSHA